MKALWKGYITLGQLGIPVRLYAATQDPGVQFVQVHEKDNSPVERPLFCKREQAEIPYDEVVKAVQVDGRYVTFTDRELDQIQELTVKAIDIRQFCVPSQIPFTYFEKPYYIVPAKGGEQAYVLLREGLARTGVMALGRFYFYGSEYIGAIGADQDMLVLYRLRFADELVPRSDIKTPALPGVGPVEIDRMKAVVERYSGPVHMRDYHNEYMERVKELFERKAKGLPTPRPERRSTEATPEDAIPSVLGRMISRGADLEHNSTKQRRANNRHA